MNSKTLLGHLEKGAKLRTRTRYGKTFHELTLATGQVLRLQYSTIKGLLKARKLHSIDYGDGNYDYYLEGQNWYDVQPTY